MIFFTSSLLEYFPKYKLKLVQTRPRLSLAVFPPVQRAQASAAPGCLAGAGEVPGTWGMMEGVRRDELVMELTHQPVCPRDLTHGVSGEAVTLVKEPPVSPSASLLPSLIHPHSHLCLPAPPTHPWTHPRPCIYP
ncbi:hypothetical protein E2C01_078579 [Portunus trituberculatus]|uniref:Uncharacterized protein n=1 Tax=Portunus trituberculatus TaxID=210409 RepID=A0A5B7IP69_PORTR|nr:hypothetical protein [Portunus trituberculatus]